MIESNREPKIDYGENRAFINLDTFLFASFLLCSIFHHFNTRFK